MPRPPGERVKGARPAANALPCITCLAARVAVCRGTADGGAGDARRWTLPRAPAPPWRRTRRHSRMIGRCCTRHTSLLRTTSIPHIEGMLGAVLLASLTPPPLVQQKRADAAAGGWPLHTPPRLAVGFGLKGSPYLHSFAENSPTMVSPVRLAADLASSLCDFCN